MKPNISVIIPTFNRFFLLKRAISSVLNQTFKNFEIIIIDNYSTDQTPENLKKLRHQRIKFYQINNEGIIAKSRNFGVLKSQGEYIAFLDDDDWWDKDKLLKAKLKLNEGFDFVYHNMFLHSNKIKKSNCRLLTKPIFNDLFCNGNPIINSSVIVKKKILFDVGLITQERKLISAEDYDTWLNIAKINENFFLIKECLGHYRVSKKSFWGNSGKFKKKFENFDRIIKKHLDSYTGDIKDIVWVDYLKVKYLSENHNFKKSNSYLKKLIKKNINLKIKIRVIYYFLRNLICLK